MTTVYTSTTVDFTTDELSLLQGSKVGSLTLPAQYFTLGKVLKLSASGNANAVGGSVLKINFKIGDQTITVNKTFDSNLTNASWSLNLNLVCSKLNYVEPEDPATQLYGSFSCGGEFLLGDSAMCVGPVEKYPLNTDSALVLDLTAQWDIENPQNIIKCTHSEIASPAPDVSSDVNSLNTLVPTVQALVTPTFGYIPGQYIDNAFHALASSTLAGAAGRIDLFPFIVPRTTTVDQIGVAVSTLIAGALGKVVIYNSNTNNWPDQRLFYGSVNLDFSTTGYKYHSESFTFQKDKIYWLGVHHSSTATLRSINIGGAANLGIANSTGSTYYTVLRRVVTFASGAPTSWVFNAAERTASITPTSIRMRVV